MRAKLIPIITFAIALLAFGLPNSAQDRPNRSAMLSACATANAGITELIELAPFGTGRTNRTTAWFEDLFGAIGDVLSWIFNTARNEQISQTSKAVFEVDVNHTYLHFDLMTILNAEYEVIEDIMPSKLDRPDVYIFSLKFIKENYVDAECQRVLGE